MQLYIKKPQIDFYEGIKVSKDTELNFKTDNIEQTVKNLQLHTVTRIEGDGYVSTHDTTVFLEEGDVLLFEPDSRGYIKPLDSFVTVEEAIDDLLNIKDIGKELLNVSD